MAAPKVVPNGTVTVSKLPSAGGKAKSPGKAKGKEGWRDIARNNKIKNPRTIHAGQKLTVNGKSYTVKKDDTLYGIAGGRAGAKNPPKPKGGMTKGGAQGPMKQADGGWRGSGTPRPRGGGQPPTLAPQPRPPSLKPVVRPTVTFKPKTTTRP